MKTKEYLVTYEDGTAVCITAKNKKEAKTLAEIKHLKKSVYSVEDYYL